MPLRPLIALLLVAVTVAPSMAQYPAKPRRPRPAPAAEKLPKVSVMINGQAIAPGEVFQTLIGAAGPPDWVHAVRGKEAANDYVLFSYDSIGLSVHIKTVNNTNNVVGAIVVRQPQVGIENVPFKVGEDYHKVMTLWGQPDQQETGYMAYWKRGVYVGVGDDGRINSITVAPPGKLDEDAPAASSPG